MYTAWLDVCNKCQALAFLEDLLLTYGTSFVVGTLLRHVTSASLVQPAKETVQINVNCCAAHGPLGTICIIWNVGAICIVWNAILTL